MSDTDWNRIKNIVGELLELAPGERGAALNHAGLSVEMRSEVESLMGFESESEDLLKLSAAELSYDFIDSDADLRGQVLGAYKIVSELGRGGMGAVYLAERVDGKFDQKVALKLLKRELNTSALRRRFEHEREILASLEHSNIARLLDAGMTDDGVPFIAMEYVDGSPIDEYCSERSLDLNGRLDLFRTVCGAVEFAHRNLIVHRDLKPSNILVTREGVPKLLDFGISKVLTEAYAGTAETITEMGVMTPSYASPEQLKRQSVTTLSDVYSLGVILFELLSGHRPFQSREGDLAEIFKAVLEKDPEPPSKVIEKEPTLRTGVHHPAKNDGDETRPLATAKAGRLRTVPEAVPLSSQSIRGDLDNIVLKALRKEPERRYTSAGQFADDIHRHLRGLPVTARPNTFSYRASKFVSRNLGGVAAASLVVVAVIAGVAATVWQTRVAQTERERAERRFNDVRSLANSFLFEISPLIEDLPGATGARRLLVVRALEYLDNLAKENTEDLTLKSELAEAYEKVGDVQGSPFRPNIGDTAGALKSYQAALAIQEELQAVNPTDRNRIPRIAYLNSAVGRIHSLGGDYAKSKGFIERGLELQQKVVAENPSDLDARILLAEMFRHRGLLPFYENDNKAAIEFYERSKEVTEQLISEHPNDPRIVEQHAFVFTAIGEAKGWDNDLQGAAVDLQRGYELMTGLAEKHPNKQRIQRALMLAGNKWAENFQDRSRDSESVALFEKGIAIAERARNLDPESSLAVRDLAMCYKKTAQAMTDAGKARPAIDRLQKAIEIFQELSRVDPTNTESPYDIANTRFSVGMAYLSLNEPENAMKSFRTADEEFKAVLATNPDSIYAQRMSALNREATAKAHMKLARQGAEAEHGRKALELFESALQTFQRLKSEGNLSDFDLATIEEIEKQIAELRPRFS